MKTARKALIAIALGVYLVGFGMLAGVALERMRYDQERAGVLDRYEAALREWHAFRMSLEQTTAHP